MKKYSCLVTLLWISLLVLAMFPFTIKPAKSDPHFTFERQWVDFNDPEFVAADSSGNFFAADAGNIRVQGFDDAGVFMWSRNFFTTVGGVGVGGVAVSDLGVIWITQPDIQAIFAQTIDNVPLRNMTTPSVFGVVAADDSGAIYIEDISNPGVVKKYVGDGGLLIQWESESYGSIIGIAVDDVFGRVYVAVYIAGSFQIRVLDSDSGELLFSPWITGIQIGGVAVDDSGDVYLTDFAADTVSKFTGDGVYLASWGGFGSDPGQFVNPKGVAVDGYGSVYVADTGNDRIQKFSQVEVPLPPAPEGSYTYGGAGDERAWSVVECDDGGFALAGSTNSFGDWPSGGGDFWLVRTDSSGVELWSRTYGGTGWDRAYSVVECVGGGFALAGYTNSSGAGGYDFWLVRTDASGNELWSQTYGGPNYEWAFSVVECVGGGFAIAGYKGFGAGIRDFWLVRTDAYGVELWSQTYGGTEDDWAWSVVECNDGGFAVAGYTNSFGAGGLDFWLVRTDSSGAVEWSQTYGGSGDDWGCSVIETSDDGFALAGYTASYGAGGPDFWLVRTDAYGVELWSQTYGGTEDDRAISVVECTDGGFALVGPTLSFGAGGQDFWLVKTDSDGVEQWNQTFGGTGNDVTWSGGETADDDYFLAGFTESFGAGNADFWLVIFEPEGGITVSNVLCDPDSPVPTEGWSYSITYPDGHEDDFTLPAGGGSISFTNLNPGTYSLTQTRKFNYATSTTLDTVEVPATTENNTISLTLDLLPRETASVVFNNAWVPEAAWAKKTDGGDSSPPSMSTYDIPCRVAVPVQVSWDPDIEPYEELDLVKDKPIKILVNLADVLYPTGPLYPDNTVDGVTVSVTSPDGFFNAPLPDATRTGAQINSNSVVIFSMDPPSNVGHYTITCTITHGVDTLSQYDTYVKVRETSPLALYYSHLYRSGDYGTEPPAAFDTMLTNTRDFVKAVYPVSGLTVGSNTDGIPGEAAQANYIGMLKDCQRIAQEAKLSFPNSPNALGVAIGPDLGGGGYKNYFAYHGAAVGKKTAVGVSFGPAVKGVVVLDGYYSAAAHEIGHTFGLYYGVPEQYTQYNPGAPANGFWAEQNEWRSGYDFMGLSQYRSTTSTWVSTETTLEPLFSGLRTSDDPQIILVNGIIYKDEYGVTSAELPFTWYSMPSGTADTIPTGEVSRFVLRFYLDDETTVETGFDAQFFLNLDPGIEAGEDLPLDIISGEVPIFGTIPVNFAGFAFATEYPQGTVQIDIVDTFQAPEDQVVATIDPEDVVSALSAGFGGFLPPIKNDGSSSFKLGSAVPVKFQLKSPEGTFITTAQARLFLSLSGTGPEISATSVGQSNTGNLFRYDVASNQYIFNLNTKSLKKGTWKLRVELGDGTLASVEIRLK